MWFQRSVTRRPRSNSGGKRGQADRQATKLMVQYFKNHGARSVFGDTNAHVRRENISKFLFGTPAANGLKKRLIVPLRVTRCSSKLEKTRNFRDGTGTCSRVPHASRLRYPRNKKGLVRATILNSMVGAPASAGALKLLRVSELPPDEQAEIKSAMALFHAFAEHQAGANQGTPTAFRSRDELTARRFCASGRRRPSFWGEASCRRTYAAAAQAVMFKQHINMDQ
jgi:hypothetical protein